MQFPIHCSATGRPIGQLSEADSAMLLAVIGTKPIEGSDALESWQDDLDMRTAAFARPAPAFAVVTESTLTRMSEVSGVGFAMVWSYLMNRWQDAGTDSAADFESHMRMKRRRIESWPQIEARFSGPESAADRTMLLTLLALDYSIGLRHLPFTKLAQSLLIPPQPGPDLDAALTKLTRYVASLRDMVAKGRQSVKANSAVAPLLRKHFWADAETAKTPRVKAVKKQSESAAEFFALLNTAVEQPAAKPATAVTQTSDKPFVRPTLKLSGFAKALKGDSK